MSSDNDEDDWKPPTLSEAEERESGAHFVTEDPDELPPSYEKPSIEKAWEFYNGNLPRRIAVIKSEGVGIGAGGMLQFGHNPNAQQSDKGTGYRMARPGETHDEITGNPAVKYSFFGNYRELDEFGIGISLYFRQLMLLFVMMSICAIVNLRTINKNMTEFQPDLSKVPYTLQGSVLNATREGLSFEDQGSADITTCAILFFFVLFLKKFEDKNIESIDLAQQTPQDYAVQVKNLPKHIRDPDVYHKFFSRWGDVVFVTVATDNGPLTKRLADLREADQAIENRTTIDTLTASSGGTVLHQSDLTADQIAKQKFGMNITIEKLQEDREAIQRDIETLSKASYDPKLVYVVFNKEKDQRQCLKDCATGLIEDTLNIQCCDSNQSSVLEGHVMKMVEPVEPSEIIYENLHVGFFDYWFGLFKSYAITFLVLLVSFFILQSLTVSAAESASGDDSATGSSTGAALFVSLLNGGLPWFLKTLTLKTEIHVDEGDLQTSILRKLMVARCVNTAVLMYIITDYTDRFGEANLAQIQSILIADCFTTPVMRLLNIYEHVQHYVVAPTMKTQAQMNLLFRGAYWNLAERYTDMIKTLFVGLFYSVVVPSSLFITAFAMMSTYIVDKYCLLRMWERPPMYDEAMAVTSRKMIMVSVWAHVVMARHFFANWPCEDPAEESNCGLWTCDEPYRETESGTRDYTIWTDAQRQVVTTYQSVGVSLGGLIIFYIFWKQFFSKIKGLFRQKIDEVGAASEIQFRNLTGVAAYIPQIRRSTMVDPLFACNVSQIPRTYVPCRPAAVDGSLLDPSDLSLSCKADLPFLNSQEEMDLLFGSCKFYEPPAAAAAQVQVLQVQQPQGGNIQMVQQMQRPQQATVGGFSQPLQMSGAQQHFAQQQQAAIQQQQQIAMQQQQQLAMQQQQHQLAMQQQQQRAMQMQSQMRANVPQQPLPAGWEAKLDPASGRTFYVNHSTKTTQWTRPQYRAAVASMPTAVAVPSGGRGGGGLPPGWEMKYTPQGRPYFMNHVTKTTQWNRPTA